MGRVEAVVFGLALATAASPAFAGLLQTPAPVAGIGIGAVVLVGIGYRAVKARIK